MRLLLWFAGPILLGIWLFGAVTLGWGDDLLIVLVILLLLVAPVARRSRRPSAEFDGAPLAVGTVVSATRTGRMVRVHRELDIRFQVHTADVQLPVRYLPDGRVIVAWDACDQEVQATIDRVNIAKEWF